MNLLFVKEKELSTDQYRQIKNLNIECFGDINPTEVKEDFIAKSFGRVFAYENDKIVGMLRLFKRNTVFDGEKIFFGGIGGVCVTKNWRGKGIAMQMLRKGFELLKDQGVDVICLNADTKKTAYKLYEKFGFKFLGRDISFKNVYGKIKYDNGSMFIPVHSQEKYTKIMNSKSIFYQGKGYW